MAASRPSQNLHPWETSITGFVAGWVVLAIGLFIVIPVAVNLPDSWPGGVFALVFVVIGIVMIKRSVWRERSEGSTIAEE